MIEDMTMIVSCPFVKSVMVNCLRMMKYYWLFTNLAIIITIS